MSMFRKPDEAGHGMRKASGGDSGSVAFNGIDTKAPLPFPLFPANGCFPEPALYAVLCDSDVSPEIAACAAANLAIGTRYGEHDT